MPPVLARFYFGDAVPFRPAGCFQCDAVSRASRRKSHDLCKNSSGSKLGGGGSRI